MKPITELIAAKTPVLMDGAIGTLLYNKGIFINRSFEQANVENPQLIHDIHLSYLQAGAQILTTNSWAANRYKLAKFNLQDKVAEINKAAGRIAKGVAADNAYVAGSVGPLGIRLEPWGPTSFAEAQQAFGEQIKALVDGGCDIIMLETFSDITEIEQAIKAAHEVAPTVPIFANLVMDLEGKLPMGTPIEWAIKKLDEWGAAVVGLNCSVGPQPMLSMVDKIKAVTNKPISLIPNAGLPKMVDGRHIYLSTPEYMAKFAKDFLKPGVQFIGGCCGTTPEHIRSMANAIRQRQAMLYSERDETQRPQVEVKATREVESVPSLPFAEKSRWSRKIAEGKFVTTIELLPPAGVDTSKIIDQAKSLHKLQVDAINIPDGPRASARMSAMLTSIMIEQKTGIETVLHYTCRDRNLLGMQSDMLGIHAIGLRNLLLVTGDPPKMGSYPDATGVFDIDSIGLTNMVAQLNRGKDLGGRSIGQPTSISIGVGCNPVARDIAYEQKRFRYKVEAGAEWTITQPVFDVEPLLRFLDFIDKNNLKIPVIAGIWPLTSYRNAVFMNNEVPGIKIPDAVMETMAAYKDNPEDAKKVGAEIATKITEKLRPVLSGVQVSAPFGRIDLALQVMGK